MNRFALSKCPMMTWALILGLSTALGACQEAPKVAKAPAPNSNVPTLKPDRVSSTQVASTVLGELSHLERAFKPMLGVPLTPPADCTKTGSTVDSLWQTSWTCGLDSTERGKKEIEGVERVNYNRKTRVLEYDARFEIRNFEDKEPRAQAHTVILSRRIRAIFTDTGNLKNTTASVRMISGANFKNASDSRIGSNWSATFDGKIQSVGGAWQINSGSTIAFSGLLFGLDGERKMMWASGDFKFVSETITSLDGFGEASCTKPLGSWRITASGGGGKFDTAVATSNEGGQEGTGGTFTWPTDLCTRP